MGLVVWNKIFVVTTKVDPWSINQVSYIFWGSLMSASSSSIKWVHEMVNKRKYMNKPVSAILSVSVVPRKKGDTKSIDEIRKELKTALTVMEVKPFNDERKIVLQWSHKEGVKADESPITLFLSIDGHTSIVKALAVRTFMTLFNASEYVKARGSVEYLTSEPMDYLATFAEG